MPVSLFRPTRRTTLTPGQLYREMSAEFRRLRCGASDLCLMPMVVPRTRREAPEPGWTVQPLTNLCPACEARAAAIYREFASRYEMHTLAAPSQPLPPSGMRAQARALLARAGT